MTSKVSSAVTPACATLVDLLRHRAISDPERLAYTFISDGGDAETHVTHAALDRAARAIAARLQDGIAPGARALLLHPAGLDAIAAFFGCLYAGVVAVFAYPPRGRANGRGAGRLDAIVRDAEPSIVLATSQTAAQAAAFVREGGAPEIPVWATDDIPAADAAHWQPVTVSSSATAFLQYSSGSTSSPKGVIVSHANVLHNERMIQRACGHTQDSTFVGWLPLHHDMGLIGNLLQPLFIGARSVLMAPSTFLQRPIVWLDAIARHRAHTSGGPNFAYEYCVRRIAPEACAGLDLASWRVAFSGAEPVRADVLERFAAKFAPYGFTREAFFPCYGLAEATLIVSGTSGRSRPLVRHLDARALEDHRAIDAAEGEAVVRTVVGCGHVVADTTVAIVRPDTGVRCAADDVGEIWVSGPAIAQGYWRQDERTHRIFHATLPDDDRRYLRTGDLGLLDRGELFVTGRMDDLIIVRGQNHYPEDLEWTLQRHDLTPLAGVFGLDVDGDTRIVVLLECDPRRVPDIEHVAPRVRQLIADEHELRVYAVVLVSLGAIPRSSSGKVQRHLCRAEFVQQTLTVLASSVLDEPARDEVGGGLTREALLAALPHLRHERLASACAREWAVLLRIGHVPRDQPLVNLGLDSLAAVEIRADLDARFGVGVPLRVLLGGASVDEIASYVLARIHDGQPGAPVRAQGPQHSWPLSAGQRALWFVHHAEGAPAAYNIARAARIRQRIDVDHLYGALTDLVARHAALRAVFTAEAGQLRQLIDPHPRVELRRESAAGWPEAALEAALADDAERPFDLERGPLVRLSVFSRSDDDHVVVLAVHHIVADLWSFGILLAELGPAYAARLAGASERSDIPAIEYGDYASWQQELLAEGPIAERLRSYWRGQLGGTLPSLGLPADRRRAPVRSGRGGEVAFRLPADLHASLGALARDAGTTLYVVLLAAFQTLLFRYTGQRDVIVGSPGTGRSRPELEDVVGYFANLLAIRTKLDPRMMFRAVLTAVHETIWDAYEHQDLPFPLVVEDVQQDRDARTPPLVEAVFVLQKAPASGVEGLEALALGETTQHIDLRAFTLEPVKLPVRTAQFDLTLTMAELKDGLAGVLRYDADLFDDARMQRVVRHFERLLASAAAGPDVEIGALDMLPASERARLIEMGEMGASRRQASSSASLERAFLSAAEARGDAVAVTCDSFHLSYDLLTARARRLADTLHAAGVRPGARVGLYLDRGPQLIEAMLGVVMAGACYVPCDADAPIARLCATIEDAGAELLLVDAFTEPRTEGAGLRTLRVDTIATPLPTVSHNAQCAGGQSAAYIIYTSGSTGVPKGVVVSHDNVVRLLEATRDSYRFGSDDVWTLFHSCAFDFSVWEIWGCLTAGGRLVVVPSSVCRAADEYLDLVRDAQVTVLNQTPTAFAQLAHADERRAGQALPALRLVIFGGEALRASHVAGWSSRHGSARPQLVNMYGITETTVHVTERLIGDAECASDGSPIGHPLAHMAAYVLDDWMQPVPLGVTGELYVGGAGVARGYHARPGLTAARFVPDPFSGEPGARLYRSGDHACRQPDGALAYEGRRDRQVKIRGHRVELGEIEAVLHAHPAVRQACVRCETHGDEPRLTAFVVLLAEHQDQEVPPDLWTFLRLRLPTYMTPSRVVALPALPLTPNGKLDVDALPAADDARQAAAGTFVAPVTALECVLADCWAEALDVDAIGVHDNFFELGGHSLLATRLAWTLQEIFPGHGPLVRLLLLHPTIAGLARALEDAAPPGCDVHEVAALYQQLEQLPAEEVDRLLSEPTVSLKRP